jgi:hypothetical protein
MKEKMTNNKAFLIGISIISLIISIFSFSSIFENVDASNIVVIQSPLNGDLNWYTTPGIKWQGFGKVTIYNRRTQHWFSSKNDQGESNDQSQKLRFNDGGHANISGGLSYDLPLDEEHLNSIHKKFGSQKAIDQQLIRTITEKSIYMTGPHMSSTESYAGRRAELLYLIEDQMKNGIFLTKTKVQKEIDPITKIEKSVTLVEIEKDSETQKPKRSTSSPLEEYGILIENLSINEIKYEEAVEQQIKEQQKSIMAVQIAIAEAKKAEQQLTTTQKEGEAAAAKAEWEQKTIAAKQEQEALMIKKVAETKAEQELEVATLAAKSAEQKKLAEIALGEGESKRRQLVMEADGALEKKLEAWVQVNSAYAKAISEHKGNWVPSVVMSGSKGNENGATQLIELLTAKTASDLGLNITNIGNK